MVGRGLPAEHLRMLFAARLCAIAKTSAGQRCCLLLLLEGDWPPAGLMIGKSRFWLGIQATKNDARPRDFLRMTMHTLPLESRTL